jgi:hypothetical protein
MAIAHEMTPNVAEMMLTIPSTIRNNDQVRRVL